MERLFAGYRRFRSEIWPGERERYETLARSGQQPETLVVACSDSRVDPQTVFGASPGELFVLRNIAGLVPPYEPDRHAHGTSAALEYGVRVLKVQRIVILGHARCGGVKAMVEGAPAEARDFVEPWMAIARRALAPIPESHACDDVLAHYGAKVVRLSLQNLHSFPWIHAAVERGELALHGCSFDVMTGVLSYLQGEQFVPVM